MSHIPQDEGQYSISELERFLEATENEREECLLKVSPQPPLLAFDNVKEAAKTLVAGGDHKKRVHPADKQVT